MKTKFSKTFTTWFFPIGDEVRQIVVDWLGFLKEDMVFGPDDPLFPATRAFTAAGLPYFHPHSFRRTLAQHGERLCHTPEEFKAWSQNLGHETVLTTFSSYDEVACERQAKLIRQLARVSSPLTDPNLVLGQILRLVQGQHSASDAGAGD